MKSLVLTLSLLFTLVSCSHHKNDPHHHHKCEKSCKLHKDGKAYGKMCAMSVSMGDTHVKGKEDYKLEHDGQTYYFSSKAKMENFKKNIKANIKAANEIWLRASSRL